MSEQTPPSNPRPAGSFTIAQTQRTENGKVASKTTTISGPLVENPVNPRATQEGKNAHARDRALAQKEERMLPGDQCAHGIAGEFGIPPGVPENNFGMNGKMNMHGTYRKQEQAIKKAAKAGEAATIKFQATVLPKHHPTRPSYAKLTAQDPNGKVLSGSGVAGDNVVFALPRPLQKPQPAGAPAPQAPTPTRRRSR